jgi:hypothetical protein
MMPGFQAYEPDDRPSLPKIELVNEPQNIKAVFEEGYCTFFKQDVPVFKLCIETLEEVRAAWVVLNGLVRIGAVFGEVEQIRDVVNDIRLTLEGK